MQLARFTLTLAVAFHLAGCATAVYRTPGAESHAASELAVIEFNAGVPAGVIPVEVDGKSRGFGIIRRYELVPGDHTMKIALNIGPGVASNSTTLAFSVNSGSTYELKYEISRGYDRGTWRAWIEEKATGRLISSEVK